MTENEKTTAILERICLDNECAEKWESLPAEVIKHTRDFVYCPYCSEELNIQCSACKEGLSSKDYKYCPWCGIEFEE